MRLLPVLVHGEFRSPRRRSRALCPKGVDIIVIVLYTVHMDELRFEWDEAKNKENVKKHGIPFEEAQTVFLDEHAVRFIDPDHSESEDRFLMLGMSFRLRVLVVCHCFRETETTIRIISARKAAKQEAKSYKR